VEDARQLFEVLGVVVQHADASFLRGRGDQYVAEINAVVATATLRG